MNVMDLARALAPDCELKVVGIRPGEKLHEVMVPEDDARHTLEFDDHYVILPSHRSWDTPGYRERSGGQPCPDGFRYGSDTNSRWLSVEELRSIVGLAQVDADA
jgi:UDP-N-acetylglucosamine 4,6-dehydratase